MVGMCGAHQCWKRVWRNGTEWGTNTNRIHPARIRTRISLIDFRYNVKCIWTTKLSYESFKLPEMILQNMETTSIVSSAWRISNVCIWEYLEGKYDLVYQNVCAVGEKYWMMNSWSGGRTITAPTSLELLTMNINVHFLLILTRSSGKTHSVLEVQRLGEDSTEE